uniref:Uncharacterized protein n=1 Tax=Medicago truncatula TaxID=3880 RepID=Q2HTA5_MEDTR|nr:hypothetical protein MtrDRAFT_AC150776g1v2 [Medicago truncatula]ABN08910.1 hypothetical protein MtrDRAFT_AC161749g4v2 [Medicago truncatula]
MEWVSNVWNVLVGNQRETPAMKCKRMVTNVSKELLRNLDQLEKEVEKIEKDISMWLQTKNSVYKANIKVVQSGV